MPDNAPFEIFLATAPGLETVLEDEVRHKGFKKPRSVPGGVIVLGGWPDVWRANLWVRGAGRVLARLATFRVTHLDALQARSRQVAWATVLRPDIPFRVEASCAKSRIYHSGAAAERVAHAIRDTLGAPQDGDDGVAVMVRLDHDVCTISLDTSGEPLHRRGYKTAVNQAPLRETLASLFLRQCGFDGSEAVLDPMCGSGTFVIEAAEIACRLNPGRSRPFAFERFANFDAGAWQRMRAVDRHHVPVFRCYGSDRDEAAVEISRENAERAGVGDVTVFRRSTISDCVPPDGPPGLVIVNPPYGARMGDKDRLIRLYRSLGQGLRQRFIGWRVGLVTSEPSLAYAAGLPFMPPGPPVPHGGLRIQLFRTERLPAS